MTLYSLASIKHIKILYFPFKWADNIELTIRSIFYLFSKLSYILFQISRPKFRTRTLHFDNKFFFAKNLSMSYKS